MTTFVMSQLLVVAGGMLSTVLMGAASARAATEEGKTGDLPWPFVLQHDRQHPWKIRGHVVDSAGRPIQGAHVAIVAQLHTMDVPYIPPLVLGQFDTDATGQYQVSLPSIPWYQCQTLTAIAGGDSYGMLANALDVAILDHQVDFQLEPETPVRGVLLKPDGSPAAGVKVNLRGFSQFSANRVLVYSAQCWPPSVPSVWPSSPVTDDKGNFTLQGLSNTSGVKLQLNLAVDDARFAPESFSAEIESNTAAIVSRKLLAGRRIEGTVICKDTGAPMAGAGLQVVSLPNSFSKGADSQIRGVLTTTDEKGRFRVNCRAGKFVTVYVYPPKGAPYPAWMEQKPLADNPADDDITIAVPRGVIVRGTVADGKSGAGISGAGVTFQPLFEFKHPRYPGRNQYVTDDVCRQIYWANERYPRVTSEDGAFETVVLPGKGHLLVKAPTPDFISKFISLGELQWDNPAAFYFGVEGHLRIDTKPGGEPLVVNIPLRRGATVHGAIVGPQGEVIKSALLLNPSYSALYLTPPNVKPIPLRNGEFKLSGYDVADPKKVFFVDIEHDWGASMVFDAQEATRSPSTVRLAPCGSATVVFLDQDNRPWANQPLLGGKQPLSFVRVEGIAATPRDEFFLASSTSDIGWSMSDLPDSSHRDLRTDAEGRVRFSGLIPGASLKLYVFTAGEGRRLWRDANAFTVEPGQNVDLGTVIVKRR
jgi:hypothetical protein